MANADSGSLPLLSLWLPARVSHLTAASLRPADPQDLFRKQRSPCQHWLPATRSFSPDAQAVGAKDYGPLDECTLHQERRLGLVARWVGRGVRESQSKAR